MKTKKMILVAFCIAVIAAVVLYAVMVSPNNTQELPVPGSTVSTSTDSSYGTTSEEYSPQANDSGVWVANISPNQQVSSPLTVTGTAKGWYFEGSFPVKLLDTNGAILWQGPATAQGDWMTSQAVPFKVTMTFATPATKTGTLLFHNDNPSGLPQNDKSYSLPVTFATETRTVSLFYYDGSRDTDVNGSIMCSPKGLVEVKRTIPKTMTPLADTLTLFFKGELSSEERSRGITTEFPLPGVVFVGASLSSNGDLRLSISDPNNKLSGGACRVSIMRAELEATARQFPTVRTIAYDSPIFEP